MASCVGFRGVQLRGAGLLGREGGGAWPCLSTLRNQTQESTLSAQFVPGMRFLVFDFGVYISTWPTLQHTWRYQPNRVLTMSGTYIASGGTSAYSQCSVLTHRMGVSAYARAMPCPVLT
eukprot:3757443-Rhodomonas_salina.2